MPFAKKPIPDPDFPYHTNEPWFEESSRAFVGLSGESRLADANSPYFRTLAGGRPHRAGRPRARPASSSSASWTSRSPACARRGPRKRPGFRPDVPCETQEVPDLNAVGGPPGPMITPSPTLPLPRASREREKARPEQYRRLREYADRTRKGLPALDPFVWWGVGERMQLKRMDLMRDEQGRLVEAEGRRMKKAIQAHLKDFAAIIGMVALAVGIGGYILANQRLRFPLIEEKPFKVWVEVENARGVTPGQGQTVRVAGMRVGDVGDGGARGRQGADPDGPQPASTSGWCAATPPCCCARAPASRTCSWRWTRARAPRRR